MAQDCTCFYHNMSVQFLYSCFICDFCPHDRKMDGEPSDIVPTFPRRRRKGSVGQGVKELGCAFHKVFVDSIS